MTIHIIIIIVVGLFSFAAFSRPELMARFQLNPWSVFHRKEYLRLLTHAFLHVDWTHLLINMFVFYSFSRAVLFYFGYYFEGFTDARFLLLFLTAIPISSLYSLFKYRNNPNYNAVGASGAVSAVVFASIFFDPYNPVYLFAIIPIPGIVFGVLYLVYSAYMARKQVDNVGHDAHFWGAVYGLIFPLFYEPRLILVFFEKLVSF
ncbi:rhomboid family intramembrane serine protease [Geofilum rubicundum]|uniref:Rhomboid family protein n=1 Tax=Geofilum rubicundum JCM 15548 TaxID=1236989 RepID=A0A0E9M1Z5_9BACT|nr:rhomboid family intramembrane serine protease [Geofilum rubicundum]GAO31145.1 rhomboid family protein [Geofilum rubicundum JCM 15548]